MLKKLDPRGTTALPDALIWAPMRTGEQFRLLMVLMAHADGMKQETHPLGFLYPVSNGRVTATCDELVKKLGPKATPKSVMSALHYLASKEYVSFMPTGASELEIEINFEGWKRGGIFDHLRKRIPKRLRSAKHKKRHHEATMKLVS